ncbi:MAG: hypothetical protein ACRD0R_15630 [Acidimicrobiales bacterium]
MDLDLGQQQAVGTTRLRDVDPVGDTVGRLVDGTVLVVIDIIAADLDARLLGYRVPGGDGLLTRGAGFHVAERG